MNTHLEPPDLDRLFSTEAKPPEGEEMVGERHSDSVLFKIKELADAEVGEPAQEIQDAKLSSGLIDVNTLLSDDKAGAPTGFSTGSLVAEVSRVPDPTPVPARRDNKMQTYVLVAGVIALLGVTVMLAFKALG